jgi:MFS family permease
VGDVRNPPIHQDLGATPSDVQLVISAYAATYAVFLITSGRFGDLFGRRRMFLLGVAGFTVASTLCGVAWSPAVLVAGRVLQGLMASVMAPQVLASIRGLFPSVEHGRALALYGATFGLANICGQVLGGVLVSSHPFGLAWQAIFLINVPVGVAAFTGGPLFLSDSRARLACWFIRWSKDGSPDGRHGSSPCSSRRRSLSWLSFASKHASPSEVATRWSPSTYCATTRS